MFEITRCDSRTAIDTCKEAGLPSEHGRPSLEVRRCGDGHPPVTEKERVIRLNGIGGVRFQKTRIEISIRVFSWRDAANHAMLGMRRQLFCFIPPTNLKIHAPHLY